MTTTNGQSQAQLRQRQRQCVSTMSSSGSRKVDTASVAVSMDNHPNTADKKTRSEEVVWGKTPSGEGKWKYTGKLSIDFPVPNSLPCAHDT